MLFRSAQPAAFCSGDQHDNHRHGNHSHEGADKQHLAHFFAFEIEDFNKLIERERWGHAVVPVVRAAGA